MRDSRERSGNVGSGPPPPFQSLQAGLAREINAKHGAINELTSRSSNKTVIKEIEYNGQKSENQADVAEMLNSFFTEIGPNLRTHVMEVDNSFEEFLVLKKQHLHMFFHSHQNFVS